MSIDDAITSLLLPIAKELDFKYYKSKRSQIDDYKKGIRNKTWMLNRNNIRYIVDNDVIDQTAS